MQLKALTQEKPIFTQTATWYCYGCNGVTTHGGRTLKPWVCTLCGTPSSGTSIPLTDRGF